MAALPGSRISETRKTTDGSTELKFRIQFSPAKSRANFGTDVKATPARRRGKGGDDTATVGFPA